MSSTMAWVVYAGGYVAGAIWVALVHWYYRRKYRSRYFPIRPYIRKRALIISVIGFFAIALIVTIVTTPYIP